MIDEDEEGVNLDD
jgi:hypothetical protein